MPSYSDVFGATSRACGHKVCGADAAVFNGVGRSFRASSDDLTVNPEGARLPILTPVDGVHSEAIEIASLDPASPEYGLVEFFLGGRYFLTFSSIVTAPAAAMPQVRLRRIRDGSPPESIALAMGLAGTSISMSVIIDILPGDKIEVFIHSAGTFKFPNFILSVHSI